jgi:predicted secreted protein
MMTHAQIIAAASGAALHAHRQYGIDRHKRIDIFDILRHSAVEVFFRPLKRICGAFVPSGDGLPGVLINSQLPLSRQRYTAAHEFGHFFLGHKTASIDKLLGRAEIGELNSWSFEDSIAEAFAAFFLMPAALVDAGIRELNVSTLTPQSIYFLSLKMGTSYRATVNQLHTLKRLTVRQAEQLRRQQPKLIKHRVSDHAVGRRDVWMVDEQWDGQPIFPATDDTVVLRLSEFPTSGYAWGWDRKPDGLLIVEDGFYDKPSDLVGGSRIREFVGRVSDIATAERMSLIRSQPWDPSSIPSSQFSLDLFPQKVKKTGPLTLPSLRRAS